MTPASRVATAARQFRYLPRTLRLVWEATPGWTTTWVGMLVVQGLLPVAIVYLTRALVDALVAAIDSGGAAGTVRPALIYVVLFVVVRALCDSGWPSARWCSGVP